MRLYVRCVGSFGFFFVKQKTAYELRISDWSSDVRSSDLDPAMAVAAMDRLVHHSTIIEMNGESYRKRSAVARINAGDYDPTNGARSEERRVGKECGSTGRSRWWPQHSNNKHNSEHLNTNTSELH